MRYQRSGLSAFVMGLLLACPVGMAAAQDDAPPPKDEPAAARPERGPRMQNPEFRKRMLEEFDKDGNGELDDAERQEMRDKIAQRREQMRGRFGGGPDGPPPPGDRPEGPPPRGERRGGPGGPGGHRGPGGPPGQGPGPGGPPPLAGLFEWFDGNHDNQLSREEFQDLAEFVHRHHRPGPPPGGPDGRGFGRRGPDGPPPGDGFGRGGPDGRGRGDGPGRRGRDGRPPRADDGGPPPADSATPQAQESGADDAS